MRVGTLPASIVAVICSRLPTLKGLHTSFQAKGGPGGAQLVYVQCVWCVTSETRREREGDLQLTATGPRLHRQVRVFLTSRPRLVTSVPSS